MLRKTLLVCFQLVLCALHAQIPSTDVYLIYLSGDPDQGFAYTEPLNISHHKGYDNEPVFSRDGKSILYVSEGPAGNTDIAAYSIGSGTTHSVTSDAESEYSPECMHGTDAFSVVRVEMDSTLDLGIYSMQGRYMGRALPFADSIGYYCNINDTLYALFRNTAPPALVLADSGNRSMVTIDSGIGRCIRMVPGKNAVSYVALAPDSAGALREFDLESRTAVTVCKTLPRSQDFAWDTQGDIFMASSDILWYFDGNETRQWYRFANFRAFGIYGITRLAFSPDGHWLVLVAADPVSGK